MENKINSLKTKKIGWIGTGVMGHAMLQHIIKAEYEVHVYNRTKSKTDNLVALWAVYHDSVKSIAENVDILFSIIWDPQSVRDTYFWGEGIIENMWEWGIIVDMTTTEPTLAKEIYTTAYKKDIWTLDAPVSGGDVWAINWQLSIMVWWEEEVYKDILPLFELMGKSVVLCGEAWAGQHTKMANQMGIAGNTIAICEAMVYAEKSWLDIEKTIQVVSGWAAGSWGWQNLAPRITKWELDTCFFVKHFIKDMKIALDECEKMNLNLPGLKLVHSLYQELIKNGEENLGTQALIKVIKKMNNL